MDKTPLYQEIAESIRKQILYGTLKPGDELLPVREMSIQWRCAPGTVQRAYQELAQQGLVISHTGQGTRVAEAAPGREQLLLRRATLAHDAEAFLLDVLAAGYSPGEVEQAVRLALDRWRVMAEEPHPAPGATLRFVGSHDPAVSLIASRLTDLAPGQTLDITFAGSLGGLIALAEYKAEIAGSHLWDEETDTYNRPFVQRLLPGRRAALLTIAHRRLGLIVQPGNPAELAGLEDLARPGLRFVNRQPGAGTRVWLDAQLHRRGIDPVLINGYEEQFFTHSEVARAVGERRAEVGLGIEAAALSYGLDFVFLTSERYDLVVPAEVWDTPPMQTVIDWLATEQARADIVYLGGYDVHATGQYEWVG